MWAVGDHDPSVSEVGQQEVSAWPELWRRSGDDVGVDAVSVALPADEAARADSQEGNDDTRDGQEAAAAHMTS